MFNEVVAKQIIITSKNGYPTLRLGYAEVILYGRWDGLSNALYSLQKDNVLWVQYNQNAADTVIETYTLLNGVVEIRYEGKSRLLKIGETIDASYLLFFYMENGC